MREIRPAILLFVIFTVICGGIYPAVVTGVARVLFPKQAMGSLIADNNGRETGSTLIGQPFSAPGFFWPRPSATSGFPYNPLESGGSNQGPTNPVFIKTVADRVKGLRGSGIIGPVPADLALASASGLDPHISQESARIQAARVARVRGVSEEAVMRAVVRATEGRQLGFLGEPRVNVLVLNLALAGLGR